MISEPTLATLLSALISATVGLLSWRLSSRVQQTAARRQEIIDQGSFIEEQRTFDKELREWLRAEIAARDRACEEELTELRRKARVIIAYWRGRALGRIPDDDTPPPEVYGI